MIRPMTKIAAAVALAIVLHVEAAAADDHKPQVSAVTTSADRTLLFVEGENLGGHPSARLAGFDLGGVSVDASGRHLVALLPALAPGTYRLDVTVGPFTVSFDAAIAAEAAAPAAGAAGPAGATGPAGPMGPAGPTGPAGRWSARTGRPGWCDADVLRRLDSRQRVRLVRERFHREPLRNYRVVPNHRSARRPPADSWCRSCRRRTCRRRRPR